MKANWVDIVEKHNSFSSIKHMKKKDIYIKVILFFVDASFHFSLGIESLTNASKLQGITWHLNLWWYF